ncbi:hypothetical protein BC629DRAFT_774362 [Irpex lacteus]|nr:hypothetical protein BC629DRAFT_774362 [Irpex lacteus]
MDFLFFHLTGSTILHVFSLLAVFVSVVSSFACNSGFPVFANRSCLVPCLSCCIVCLPTCPSPRLSRPRRRCFLIEGFAVQLDMQSTCFTPRIG